MWEPATIALMKAKPHARTKDYGEARPVDVIALLRVSSHQPSKPYSRLARRGITPISGDFAGRPRVVLNGAKGPEMGNRHLR